MALGLRLLPFFLSLLVLGGCTSYRDELIARGYPPAYADGHGDGCLTGKQAMNGVGYVHKDQTRFATERAYAQGWNEGYAHCVALAQSEEQRRYWEQLHDNDSWIPVRPGNRTH